MRHCTVRERFPSEPAGFRRDRDGSAAALQAEESPAEARPGKRVKRAASGTNHPATDHDVTPPVHDLPTHHEAIVRIEAGCEGGGSQERRSEVTAPMKERPMHEAVTTDEHRAMHEAVTRVENRAVHEASSVVKYWPMHEVRSVVKHRPVHEPRMGRAEPAMDADWAVESAHCGAVEPAHRGAVEPAHGSTVKAAAAPTTSHVALSLGRQAPRE